MVEVICPKCNDEFGVDGFHAYPMGAKALVLQEFHCPYCSHHNKPQESLQIKRMTGGVNISGSASVGGDVVGGDYIKIGK